MRHVARIPETASVFLRALRVLRGARMPPYLRLGSIPRKRHIAHRVDPGYRGEGIYYEEVITIAGFGRAYSVCYHLRPPTRVRKVEPAGTVPLETVAEPVLRHHHLRTAQLKPAGDV